LLPKLQFFAKRGDFEGADPPEKLKQLEAQLRAMAKQKGMKEVELKFDEEHELWYVRFVSSQGAEHLLNWELASTPEYRQMVSKYKTIAEYMQPPFVIESVARSNGQAEDELSDAEKADQAKAEAKNVRPAKRKAGESETVEKPSVRELFDYMLNEGRKEYIVQRYKGLGEMTAEQLWQTTMDPERRTLLSVKLEDLAETEAIFSTLMGEDVEARRKFIEDNALDVKNLDI
ncbi:MAG: DNA gyrase subunit B, partial [Candidatus Aminicenantales bacterium]